MAILYGWPDSRNHFLENNLILQHELTPVGSFGDIARGGGIEYGPVLVIKSKLAVMSF